MPGCVGSLPLSHYGETGTRWERQPGGGHSSSHCHHHCQQAPKSLLQADLDHTKDLGHLLYRNVFFLDEKKGDTPFLCILRRTNKGSRASAHVSRWSPGCWRQYLFCREDTCSPGLFRTFSKAASVEQLELKITHWRIITEQSPFKSQGFHILTCKVLCKISKKHKNAMPLQNPSYCDWNNVLISKICKLWVF